MLRESGHHPITNLAFEKIGFLMILSCPNCAARFKVKPEALGTQGRTVKCAKSSHKWHASAEDGEEGPAAPAGAPTVKKKAAAPAKPKAAAQKPKAAAQKTAAKKAPAAPPPDVDDDEDAGAGDPPPPPPPPRSDGPAYEEPPLDPNERIVPRQRSPKVKKSSPIGAWIFLGILIVGTAIGGFFFRHDIVKAYRPANAIFSAIGFPVDTLGFGLQIEQPSTKAIIKQDERMLEVSGVIANTTSDPVEVPLLRGALRDAQGNDLHVWTFRTDEERILPGETVSYTTGVANPPRGATGLHVTFTRPDEMAEEMNGSASEEADEMGDNEAEGSGS